VDFSDQSHVGVFICTHVLGNTRSVAFVTHETDGDWVFACGDEDHPGVESWHVIGLSHLVERDATLASLMDLDRGWSAERISVEGPWRRTQLSDEDK
jgi:hypothetical protein